MPTNIYTIEQTSKRFKLQLVLARLCYAIAVVWFVICLASAEAGDQMNAAWPVLMFVFAAAWAFVTRVRIWWNHG